MSETTFSEARVGDRVYSPLYACENPGDKTNAVISNIRISDPKFPRHGISLIVLSDVGKRYESISLDGQLFEGGGQVLFWENPIQAIPTRPKRKATKKGWIGIMPVTDKNVMAYTTGIYDTPDGWLSSVDKSYKIQQIQFEIEE